MKSPTRPQSVALAALAVGVATTLFAWYFAGHQVSLTAQREFEHEAQEATAMVERRFQRYIDLVHAQDAFAVHEALPTREQFHAYVEGLKLQGRYMGAVALQFVRRVPDAQRDAFVEGVRRDRSLVAEGYPAFDIRPEGRRPEYWVIDFVEPMEGNEPAFGLDLRMRDTAVGAAERARDTGEPSMTGPYRLVQETGNSFGVVIYLPVFTRPRPVSEAARREALKGFVNVVLRVDDLFTGLLADPALDGLELTLHDRGPASGATEPAGPANRIFHSARAHQPEATWPRSRPRLEQLRVIAGRQWSLGYVGTPRLDPWLHPLPLTVLACGFAMSLLLFAMLQSAARRRTEALVVAEQATRELRGQLSFNQQLLEAIPSPVFFKDAQGRYIGCNEAFEEHTGISRVNLIGRTGMDWLPPEAGERARDADQRLFDNPGTEALEMSYDVPGEATRHLIVNKATFYDVNGAVAGLVGVITDISVHKQLEAVTRDSHERLRAVIEAAPLAIVARDPDGVIRMWNPAATRLYGWTEEEVLGTNTVVVPPHLLAEVKALQARAQAGEIIWIEETQRMRRDGSLVDVSLSLAPIHGADGSIIGTMATIADISARKQAQAALRESEAQLRLAMEAGQMGMWHWEATTDRFTYSDGLNTLFGRAPDAGPAHYSDLQRSLHPEDREHFEATVRHAVREGTDFQVDYRVVWPDLTIHWIANRGQVHRDADGRAVTVIGVAMDITDRKLSEQRIVHMAHHDALTGLPNRALLRDRIQQAIAQAHRSGQQIAVLFIDLDRFKTINDSLGHALGDRLLQSVASRILVCVREGDTVSRVGGDEFVIVIPNLSSDADASVVATKILEVLSTAFHLHGNDLHVGASIGIALYPSDGADAETLMRNADTAMYHAKDSGRGNFQFFTPHMNVAAQQRLLMENALRRALDNHEFELHYQPLFDLRDRSITGFEALLRWNPPGAQPVGPSEFIAVAEESGLIVPIGEWVLREALMQARAWQAAGRSLLVAVNVSARQLSRSSFLDRLRATLLETGIDPSLVELEVTEGVIIEGAGEARDALDQIAALGVGIAIDDFGTGYSGLAYLKRLPIDTVKIDQSFVRDLTVDPDDAAIVTAIVAMAKSLGVDVVAEGVETEEQLAELQRLGCNRAQGYLLARPMSAADVATMLAGRGLVAV